ncbi:hypothetical protein LX36DRAFT_219613 [Colletotrichum falcatum]|nr:hypothetical protein LX36DRAFT_219613 [Colletotrichum falcatum]
MLLCSNSSTIFALKSLLTLVTAIISFTASHTLSVTPFLALIQNGHQFRGRGATNSIILTANTCTLDLSYLKNN